MRKFTAAAALLLLASPIAAQDTTPPPIARAQAADDLMAMERAWVAAMTSNDQQELEQILHPLFRLIVMYSEDRPLTSREIWLRNTGMLYFNKVEIVQPVVTISGNMATVTMTMHLDWGIKDGPEWEPSYHLTDTWIKTDNGWQVIQRISDLAEVQQKPVSD